MWSETTDAVAHQFERFLFRIRPTIVRSSPRRSWPGQGMPARQCRPGNAGQGMEDVMNAAQSILSDEMLSRFAERRAGYDRDNRFFQEDFDDLKRAGYLTMAVPRELGGLGYTLAQCCR